MSKLSEWISVKDKLPLEGVVVLTYSFDEYLDEYYYGVDEINSLGGWMSQCITTHWMPFSNLPKPPNEQEKTNE